uniref:recombinase family protein n=1 Tax=uncultured Sphingomonas sp. TaxID=158754 RepID=UPI0025CC8C2D|nr:recombinase family protein [uncultured Sphingomonas sp.]
MSKARAQRVCFYARCFLSPAPPCECFHEQIARARHWCAERGATLVDLVVEDLVGIEAFNRPRFNVMLSRTHRLPVPFDVLLVDTRRHFSRSTRRLTYSAECLRRQGIRLEAIADKIPANLA